MDTVHATEEWRPIEGWPYEVSSLGRVRRAAPENNTWAGRIMKMALDGDGYRRLMLSHRGRRRLFRVSVLVCRAFHGEKPSPAHQVRHLDGSRDNDVPGNLVWGTGKENCADRRLHGRALDGDRNHGKKLTGSDVAVIRAEYHALGGKPPHGWATATARRYGVRYEAVRVLVKGQTWRSTPA